MNNKELNKSVINWKQDNPPSKEDGAQVGDVWANTKDNKICHRRYLGDKEYWDCGRESMGLILHSWLITPHIVERFNFAVDTALKIVGNITTSQMNYQQGCSSSSYFYIFGGRQGSNTCSLISKYDILNNNSTIIGNLSNSKCFMVTCNCSSFGYSMGGATGAVASLTMTSKLERILFNFDSNSVVVGNLSKSKNDSQCFNNTNYGYIVGGDQFNSDAIPTVLYSEVERLKFPFDSGTTNIMGNLSYSGLGIGALNSSNYGFGCGGCITLAYATSSFINRLDFANDAGNMINVGNLSTSDFYKSGINSNIAGYLLGGNNVSNIDKIIFPFDSGLSSVVANFSSSFANNLTSGFDNTDFVLQFV